MDICEREIGNERGCNSRSVPQASGTVTTVIVPVTSESMAEFPVSFSNLQAKTAKTQITGRKQYVEAGKQM
jgi:hypothetical protein